MQCPGSSVTAGRGGSAAILCHVGRRKGWRVLHRTGRVLLLCSNTQVATNDNVTVYSSVYTLSHYNNCSQGPDVTSIRNVSATIKIEEIPYVMRALGFYPSELEVGLTEVFYCSAIHLAFFFWSD